MAVEWTEQEVYDAIGAVLNQAGNFQTDKTRIRDYSIRLLDDPVDTIRVTMTIRNPNGSEVRVTGERYVGE